MTWIDSSLSKVALSWRTVASVRGAAPLVVKANKKVDCNRMLLLFKSNFTIP